MQSVDERAHAIGDRDESVPMQYGLDEARVRQPARAFIEGLDEHEQLVLVGTLPWG